MIVAAVLLQDCQAGFLPTHIPYSRLSRLQKDCRTKGSSVPQSQTLASRSPLVLAGAPTYETPFAPVAHRGVDVGGRLSGPTITVLNGCRKCLALPAIFRGRSGVNVGTARPILPRPCCPWLQCTLWLGDPLTT
jgi:hypothetical protein